MLLVGFALEPCFVKAQVKPQFQRAKATPERDAPVPVLHDFLVDIGLQIAWDIKGSDSLIS